MRAGIWEGTRCGRIRFDVLAGSDRRVVIEHDQTYPTQNDGAEDRS